MALYILANMAYLSVMTAAEILVLDAVAVTFGLRVLGVMSWIMPASVACSTFGAANGSTFGNARVAFVAAREGHLMDFLSFVSVRWRTPLPASFTQGIIALAMIAAGNISSLIDVFSFTAWIFYGLAFASVLIMRRTKRNLVRSYTVPIVFPIFMLLVSIGLVIIPIVQDARLEYLYAGLFILSGLIFYVPLVYYRKTPKFMRGLTLFIQRTFGVAPSSVDPDTSETAIKLSQLTEAAAAGSLKL
ncbi:b(0,+)-type amino acid transporter 1 [Hypsibius exemplaris]|uniref:B(0,+)-type amino acid transporter 1 n=1 Tax=Hypsibius exemplaris TaxID=2072580 RepID=A0A9X6RLD6_HYPEX|nr:b(0,+)-type amino acid transporter 1 [Hypsibius exemplaris]